MTKILRALDNEEISITGVYGMARVGKTTIMKEVAKQVKRVKKFSEVVMVTISQSGDLIKIQKEIANRLGLKLEEDSISVRALRLAARLKLEKKILIILDDVWERLELSQVGIAYGAEHTGCRIISTTRNLEVITWIASIISMLKF